MCGLTDNKNHLDNVTAKTACHVINVLGVRTPWSAGTFSSWMFWSKIYFCLVLCPVILKHETTYRPISQEIPLIIFAPEDLKILLRHRVSGNTTFRGSLRQSLTFSSRIESHFALNFIQDSWVQIQHLKEPLLI